MPKYSSGKPTIYDVAKKAGVSPATVSRVLNHQTQVKRSTLQNVITAIGELGFTPDDIKYTYNKGVNSKSLSTQTEDVYLLCLNFPSHELYSDLIAGATASAKSHQSTLLLYTLPITESTIDHFLSFCTSYNIKGIITTESLKEYVLDRLTREVSVVQCLEYNSNRPEISSISIDDKDAIEKILKHILSIGRRKIGIITLSSMTSSSSIRKNVVSKLLAEAKITRNPQWLIQINDLSYALAFEAALQLLSQEDFPDAILCSCDIFAAAATNAAKQLNKRVPNDVSIVGFDNTRSSYITSPQITTIAQPGYRLGYQAFDLLIKELQNPLIKKQHIFLDNELLIRGSTVNI